MIKLISIFGETAEWVEGNHGALDIKLRRGTSVVVKCDRSRELILTAQPEYDTWCRAEFIFCKKGVVATYNIEIYSENADSILEIVDALWDTKVESVLVHESPSLVSIKFHNVHCFNFTGCPNIKHLDCDYFKGENLDLSSLSNLESLRCQSGEAIIIELSNNPSVVSLDLCGCKMKTLKVSNQTALKNLNIDYCNTLKPRTKLWLEDKLMGTNGTD